jgi:hypothetical protein
MSVLVPPNSLPWELGIVCVFVPRKAKLSGDQLWAHGMVTHTGAVCHEPCGNHDLQLVFTPLTLVFLLSCSSTLLSLTGENSRVLSKYIKTS